MTAPDVGRATNLGTLAERTALALRVPRRAVKIVVEQFLDELADELRRGNEVYLRRFGRFVFRDLPANVEFYRGLGVTVPEGDVRIRICRFALVRVLRRQVNGLVTVPDEPEQRALPRQPVRTRSGITLAAIVARLNSEVDHLAPNPVQQTKPGPATRGRST